MATAATLLSESCTSGVGCLDRLDLLKVMAQSLAQQVDMTAEELKDAACTSGIACLSEKDLLVVIAEALAQLADG